MAVDNRLFDDLAKVAGGAVSLLSSVGKQIQSDAMTHLNGVASKMDLADRKDLDRLLSMVAQFRLEQEQIKLRLDALEGQDLGKISAKKSSKAKSVIKKPAAKKSKSKK